jgi:hypothetical protein
MTEELVIRDGQLEFPSTPGLGTALRPAILQRSDAHIEVSDLANRKDVSSG